MVKKQQDVTLGVLTHVLTLFSSFIAPLIILLVAEDTFSRNNARAALNWQISLAIYMFISFVLVLLLIGILFVIVLSIINLILIIIAAVQASKGEVYSYPLAIPFLSLE
jgi:uncharacterized protein